MIDILRDLGITDEFVRNEATKDLVMDFLKATMVLGGYSKNIDRMEDIRAMMRDTVDRLMDHLMEER